MREDESKVGATEARLQHPGVEICPALLEPARVRDVVHVLLRIQIAEQDPGDVVDRKVIDLGLGTAGHETDYCRAAGAG